MNFNNDKAIYLQLADYFFKEILKKNFKANDRIQSVRDVALEIEVNPNTVLRTYQYLQDQNIIYNKRGIGYFISEDAYSITYDKVKQVFVNQTLKECFSTMKLLNISVEELNKFWEDYNSQNSPSGE